MHDLQGCLKGQSTLLQNRKNTSERLELKKYNKYLRRHTIHKVWK